MVLNFQVQGGRNSREEGQIFYHVTPALGILSFLPQFKIEIHARYEEK